MRIRLSLFIFLLLAAIPVGAQDLEARVQELVEQANIHGLSVAVVTDGRISWRGAFGVRSTATNPPVDTTSVFEAASLTKPVVAYAALQLVDEGRLNLDRPLSEYVEYPDLAHSTAAAGITARMVLSHVTGLPNWRGQHGQLSLINRPGQAFGYSGEGFVYLQLALETIAARPLHALVADRVLEPLGMSSSSLVWQESFGPRVAVGHGNLGEAFDKFTPALANAAYSLHTTASDYARFLAAALSGEGLSAAVHGEMISKQSDAGDGLAWGLGWGLEETRHGTALWHWGDNRGYKAFVAGYPGQGRGFVFFANSDNGMLALHRLVEVLDGTSHPAVSWLNYERFDTPAYQVGRRLAVAMADSTSPPLREVYRDLRREFPADAFDEYTLNDLGYRLIRSGRLDLAIQVFEFNVSQYPDAANPYDSLGEAYMLNGELDKALLNYRVSVELDPGNDSGRAMIARLEAQLDSGP